MATIFSIISVTLGKSAIAAMLPLLALIQPAQVEPKTYHERMLFLLISFTYEEKESKSICRILHKFLSERQSACPA